MISGEGGDIRTGRDAVNCTDEEPFKGSIPDGVLECDEGYGTLAPVSMLDVLSIPSTCLARIDLCVFVVTEKV